MKCKKVKDRLSQFVVSDLSTSENNMIINHLKTCAACRQELLEFQKLYKLLSEVKITEEVLFSPESFLENFHNRFRRSLELRKSRPMTLRLLPVGIAVVLILLISIVKIVQLPKSGNSWITKENYLELFDDALLVELNLKLENEDFYQVFSEALQRLRSLDDEFLVMNDDMILVEELLAKLTKEEAENFIINLESKYKKYLIKG
jgi:hypothetical protein